MAIVSSVKKVRKHMEVIIDGERIHLAMSTFRERPLAEGQEIDLEDYKQFVLLRQYLPALKHAGDLLAAKGYAEKELERTLIRGGYLPETAEMVIVKLHTLGLLNDQAYAELYVDSHAGIGHGAHRLRQDMHRKGIDEETIRAALERLDPDVQKETAFQLARRAMQKKRPGEGRKKVDQRVMNLLVRRGYSFDDAKYAIERVHEELGEEDEPEDEAPSEEEQLNDAAALVRKALARSSDEDSRKTSQRILAMLARRGYPYSIAKDALTMVLEESEEES